MFFILTLSKNSSLKISLEVSREAVFLKESGLFTGMQVCLHKNEELNGGICVDVEVRLVCDATMTVQSRRLR